MVLNLSNSLDLLNQKEFKNLVLSNHFQNLRQVAKKIPYMSLWCLECRLAPNQDRVDLNICINPRKKEHNSILQWNSKKPHEKVSENLESFCKLLSENSFEMTGMIGELWSVYDFEEDEQEQADILKAWNYVSFLKTPIDQFPRFKAKSVCNALMTLYGLSSFVVGRRYFQFLASIPKHIRLEAVGIVQRKEGASFRVILDIRTSQELQQELLRLGWDGDRVRIEGMLKQLSEPGMTFALSLDYFNGKLSNSLGLEFRFDLSTLKDQAKRFSTQLAEIGLCSKEKLDDLIGWNSDYQCNLDGFWNWKTPVEGGVGDHMIKKVLLHQKITFSPEAEPLAKAYLFFFNPSPISD